MDKSLRVKRRLGFVVCFVALDIDGSLVIYVLPSFSRLNVLDNRVYGPSSESIDAKKI